MFIRAFLEKGFTEVNGHLPCLPAYSRLTCFYVRLFYIMFGSAATPGVSNRWLRKHCIMGPVVFYLQVMKHCYLFFVCIYLVY